MIAALVLAQAEPADQQAARRASDVDRAVAGLVALEQQLRTGNTTGAEEILSDASAVLSPLGRTHVEAARNAIENEDLSNARWYLIQAINDR